MPDQGSVSLGVRDVDRPAWRPSVYFAVVGPALVIFALVLFAPQILNDGDSFWHVAAGEWMLRHGEVVRTDPFSFTFAGRPWHAHEWLAEVVFALAFRAVGWAGVLAVTAGAAAVAIAALGEHLVRRLSPVIALVFLVLIAGCLAAGLLARPHVLALPLLALWTTALLRARAQGRAPSLGWLPLMTVWANSHASFLLGLALIGPFALEALIAAPDSKLEVLRAWGLFAAGALVAALITPFGIGGLLFPLTTSGMASLASIVEWRSPDFQRPQPLEMAILATLFVLLSRGVRVPMIRLLLLLVLLHMTLSHVRHEMLLAIIGGLVLAEVLADPKVSNGQAVGLRDKAVTVFIGVLVAGGLVFVRAAKPIVRLDSSVSPVTALAHVPPALRSQPVLNDYGMGGYLIFHGVRPFIDGRTDMYGDAFNARYDSVLRGDKAALDAALLEYNVSWTILNPASPVVSLLDATPGWRRIYGDRFAIVQMRDAGPQTIEHPTPFAPIVTSKPRS